MEDGIKVIYDITDKEYDKYVKRLHEGVGKILEKYGLEHVEHGSICEMLNNLSYEMDLPIYFVPYSFDVLINAKDAKGRHYEFPILLAKFKLIYRDFIRGKLSI